MVNQLRDINHKKFAEICKEYEIRTGLLTIDVLADSKVANKLLDKILNHSMDKAQV